MNELMKKHKAAVAQVPRPGVPRHPLHGHRPLVLLVGPRHSACVPGPSEWGRTAGIWCSWEVLLRHSLLFQASRDLAQMNDLQAQLEEANKEKQELQEKVGTRISLGRERVPGSLFVGTSSQAHRFTRASFCHQSASVSAKASAWSHVTIADVFGFNRLILHFYSLSGP